MCNCPRDGCAWHLWLCCILRVVIFERTHCMQTVHLIIFCSIIDMKQSFYYSQNFKGCFLIILEYEVTLDFDPRAWFMSCHLRMKARYSQKFKMLPGNNSCRFKVNFVLIPKWHWYDWDFCSLNYIQKTWSNIPVSSVFQQELITVYFARSQYVEVI